MTMEDHQQYNNVQLLIAFISLKRASHDMNMEFY